MIPEVENIYRLVNKMKETCKIHKNAWDVNCIKCAWAEIKKLEAENEKLKEDMEKNFNLMRCKLHTTYFDTCVKCVLEDRNKYIKRHLIPKQKVKEAIDEMFKEAEEAYGKEFIMKKKLKQKLGIDKSKQRGKGE